MSQSCSWNWTQNVNGPRSETRTAENAIGSVLHDDGDTLQKSDRMKLHTGHRNLRILFFFFTSRFFWMKSEMWFLLASHKTTMRHIATLTTSIYSIVVTALSLTSVSAFAPKHTNFQRQTTTTSTNSLHTSKKREVARKATESNNMAGGIDDQRAKVSPFDSEILFRICRLLGGPYETHLYKTESFQSLLWSFCLSLSTCLSLWNGSWTK